MNSVPSDGPNEPRGDRESDVANVSRSVDVTSSRPSRSGRPGREDRGRRRERRGRRAFLAGAGAALTTLSGCTFNINVGGGGSTQPTATPRRSTPTRSPTPTATPTPTPTPEPETDFVVLTVQPQIGTAVFYTVAPTEERYRVERLYLYVESADDGVFNGPNSEEIYGEIYVTATDGQSSVETTYGQSRVWDIDRNNAREIVEGGGRLLRLDFTPIEFVFSDTGTIDRSQAYIEVSAKLREADKGANADDEFVMFKSQNRWYLDDDPSPPDYVADNGESFFKLEFADGGSLLNLTYNVTQV